MNEERAYAINSAIIDFGLAHPDLGLAKPNAALLQDVSLAEMLEAANFVDLDNKTKPKNADGSRSISMVPDPRLISAVYTLLHYRVGDFEDDDIVVTLDEHGRRHFLAVGFRRISTLKPQTEDAA